MAPRVTAVLPLLLLVVLAGGLAGVASTARILGVFPFPGRSHVVIYSSLLRGLAARGHNVTVFSAYSLDQPVANYTAVKLALDLSAQADIRKNKGLFSFGEQNPFFTIVISHVLAPTFTEQTFQQSSIQDLIATANEKFDLVIIEDLYADAFAGFAHKFDAPLIYMSPITGYPWTNDLIGNPSPDSYVPSIFSQYSDHMTFRERLFNTVINTFGRLFRQLYYIPRQNSMMRQYFKGVPNLPHISEIITQRTALVFTYAMPGVSYPQPLLPNLIQIGGMHLKPVKPLPKDLKKYLDDASEGVIYFSMGSNLRSADFSEEQRDAFFKTFSKLKQKILWKFEEDQLTGQPKNLKISKWFPQNDILAHPNVILFITHGGILSTQEALYHGVPVIGIPIYGDQAQNMKTLENLDCGLQLKYSDINDASFESVVKEAITNPKYLKRAKEVSRIFRDQPQSPLEKGVFWTEYVLRHKGAAHLRSAATDLSWYQYLLLDVVAVLVLVPAALVYCVLMLCRRLCCATKKIVIKDVKKKKKQ
ncbi:UDP-glycosyltransferase UGT5-like [Bacillus rossius redtenbacheri]|uniref:UDP-glycosyltransferase UGT5-like n=1 Tax=Bacillus rossius redtenbacheri TaxID=93214 RepID=UPI002FDEB75F